MPRRKTADDIANEMLATVDLTHAICNRRIEAQQDTIAALKEQNEQLFTIIQRMVNGATCTMGKDSCEYEYAHIRQVVLDLGRDALSGTNRRVRRG